MVKLTPQPTGIGVVGIRERPWPLYKDDMRVDPALFRQLDLRMHEFLSDVPLHDVWRVELAPRDGGYFLYGDLVVSERSPMTEGRFAR